MGMVIMDEPLLCQRDELLSVSFLGSNMQDKLSIANSLGEVSTLAIAPQQQLLVTTPPSHRTATALPSLKILAIGNSPAARYLAFLD